MSAPPPAAPAIVFTSIDAARLLGISVSYVGHLRRSGVAHPSVAIGLGGRRAYSEADLRRLADRLGRTLPPIAPSAEAA